MRILHTNDMLIKTYLRQNLLEGRNPRDSLWFNRQKLYSYESHMATITVDNVLFINADLISYSNTTSAHISSLRSIASDLQTFIIPLNMPADRVVDWYFDTITKHIIKYTRARNTKAVHKSIILGLINKVEDYVEYMKFDKQNPAYLRKHDITKQLFEHQIL